MIKRMLCGLSPQQAATVISMATFVTVIGALILAWAFRRWNARKA